MSSPPYRTDPADTSISGHMSHSIGAVERDTGLSKDTLRVWERRYQFPQPQRDAHGERSYSPEQLDKLRLLKRLIDCGHRPGKIIGLEIDALRALYDGLQSRAPVAADSLVDLTGLQTYVDLCKTHQAEVLRRSLMQSLLRMGLQAFVIDLIAPLTTLVGEHWAQGQLSVDEEHLYTELVQNLLRNAISEIGQPQGARAGRIAPRILLTTFPQEGHGLGLLMAEVMFSLEGAHCISLGLQTPVVDIVHAAAVHQADVVALSFSAVMNLHQAQQGLNDLRAGLAASTEIWAGGRHPLLTRRQPPSGVRLLDLSGVAEALRSWRERHDGERGN